MSLKSSVQEISQLSAQNKERMFKLMELYYENLKRENFFGDLADKKWAIILSDEQNQIQGFTTLKISELNSRKIKGIYSGDTIIHQDFWGSLVLPKVWAKFVFSLVDKSPEYQFYWFLLSKGYRTYLYLPIFFQKFFPRYDQETPAFEKNLMNTFANMLYPENYDPQKGVLSFRGKRDRLKPEIAMNKKGNHNPHISYFYQKNPGHIDGDELICLAELTRENLKPKIYKILFGRKK